MLRPYIMRNRPARPVVPGWLPGPDEQANRFPLPAGGFLLLASGGTF